MTAEERLVQIKNKMIEDNKTYPTWRVRISLDDISLIADLVVERLNGSRNKG